MWSERRAEQAKRRKVEPPRLPALRPRLGRAATAQAPAASATGREVVEAKVVFSTSR